LLGDHGRHADFETRRTGNQSSVEPDRSPSSAGRQTLGEPTRRRQAIHEPTRPTTYRTLRISIRPERHLTYKSAIQNNIVRDIEAYRTKHNITDEREPLGARPTTSAALHTWTRLTEQYATTAAELDPTQTQYRGRSLDRSIGIEL